MLVRGKYVITDPSRVDGIIEEGAVCIRSNLIVDVGTYSQLVELYPDEDEIGSDEYVVLPGLINAHDHGRAPSSFQLGVADDYLEFWLMALMGQQAVDPYLATALRQHTAYRVRGYDHIAQLLRWQSCQL